MRALYPVIAALLALAGDSLLAAEEPASLRLVGSSGDETFDQLVVVGRELHIREENGTRPVPRDTIWRLKGDLRANAKNLELAPRYFVREFVTQPFRPEAPVTKFGLVVRRRGWPWGEIDSTGSIVVIAWMRDARPVRVSALPVFRRGDPSHSIAAIGAVELDAELAGATPVVLLQQKGRFLDAERWFETQPADQALHEIYFGTEQTFQTAVGALTKPDTRGENSGRTLLHFAAQENFVPAIQTLIEAGASPDVDDLHLEVSLHAAARRGQREAARALLDAGARPSIHNRDREQPLDLATGWGHLDLALELLQTKTDRDRVRAVFELAAERVDRTAIERLLARGDSRLVPAVRSEAFSNVVLAGDLELIDLLLSQGMRVDSADLLLAAAARGDVAVLERLLARGAKVNRAAADRSTPLMVAAWHGHAAVVERLLAAGAKLDARRETGETALSFALEAGHVQVEALLRARGASPNDRSKRSAKWSVRQARTEQFFARLRGEVYRAHEVDEPPVLEQQTSAAAVQQTWIRPEPVRVDTWATDPFTGQIYPKSMTMFRPGSVEVVSGRDHWAAATLIVEPDGSASHVQIIYAMPWDFSDSVQQALREYRYRPGRRNGEAVRTRIIEVVTVDE